MSEVGIFSSRTFNMSGFEIAKDGKIIPEGQIFFGADFILKNNDEYTLIIQHVRNLEQTQKIKLAAKTERQARRETNKINPNWKTAYNKPSFIEITRYNEKLEEQKTKAGDNFN